MREALLRGSLTLGTLISLIELGSKVPKPVDVLLLNIVPFVGNGTRRLRDVFAPIGVAYLAEMARFRGHTAAIAPVGLEDYAPSEVERALAVYAPQVIGISATGNDLEILAASVETALRLSPQSYVVAGGYCSQRSDAVSEIPGIDAVIVGEGELALARLLEQLKTNTLRKDGITRVIQGENIHSLDDLPVPSYMNYPSDGRYVRIYASRGCPYRCSFCQIKGFLGTPTIRYHSKEYIERLLGKLIAAHSVRPQIVLFNDDEFLLSPRHLKGMASVVREFGLRMRFQTRVTDVLRHLEVVHANRDVIDVIHLGVESFSDAQLKRWDKDATATDNRGAVKALSDIGVAYYPNIILSDAKTTPDEIEETIDGILQLPLTNIWTGVATTTARASPLDIGLQLSRYKNFFGEPERDPQTDYLDDLWHYIGATKRHSDRLETAYVNSTVRGDVRSLRASIDDLLRGRLISIAALARVLAATASSTERVTIVSEYAKVFARDTAHVLFGAIDAEKIAALHVH